MSDAAAARPGAGPPRAYHLGPMRLQAPLPLPLLAASAAAEADAIVRVAAASPIAPHGDWVRTSALSIEPDGGARMDMAGTARIEVRGGCDITITPTPGLTDADAAALLMAGPLAALCWQRGLVPFRFAVVAVGGAAVVLAGVAGVGKSTLALALAARGARLVSDDLSIVSFPDVAVGSPRAVAWPGIRRIAVWGDIPAAVAPDTVASPIRDGISRWFVDVAGGAPHPLPIRAMVLLRVGAQGTQSCWRMGPADAAARLLDAATQRAPVRRLGGDRVLLATVARLCRAVPTYRLERPAQLSALPALADRVLAIAGEAEAP